MADPKEKQVSIHNRGIRTYRLPGGVELHPGASVEVPESIAHHYLGVNGYPRDLVDASTLAPAQTSKLKEVEAANAALTAEIEALKALKPGATDEVVALRKENADVKAANEALQEKVAKLQEKIEKLKDK